MLIKSKIYVTALAVYEMVAVSALHFQRVCDAMFTTRFCDGWYRYFLWCVIVPLVVSLILMWIREIVVTHRRRAFIRRARNTVNGIMSSIRGKISNNIDMRDMEKIITAAILVGIKKYADRHPNMRDNVNHIMGVASGETDIEAAEIEEAKIVKPRTKSKAKNAKAKRKK